MVINRKSFNGNDSTKEFKKMKRLIAACIILAASALVFTSCGSESDDSDEDEEISFRSKKKERVEKKAKDEDEEISFRSKKKERAEKKAKDEVDTRESGKWKEWAVDEEKASFAKEEKESSKNLSVGFSQVGAESDWRKASTESIKEAAKLKNINLTFSDAMQKQENQIKAIRTFIKKEVDVIAFSPVWPDGFEPVLKEARKAGIPVVLFDRTASPRGVDVSDPSLYVSLVGSDFVEEGRRAARWLLAYCGENANVVELRGTVGSAPAIERNKGFMEVIKDHPGIKIIYSQSGDFTRAKGKEVMESFLKSPEADQIQVLFAHNDDMALGAIQAIEEAGKKPGKDIIIISVDGVKTMFQAILDGKANCTVECNPLIGPQLFDVIEKVAKGETVPAFVPSVEGVYDSIGYVNVGTEREPVITTRITEKIVDGRKY